MVAYQKTSFLKDVWSCTCCYYVEKWLWWCCYGETNSLYFNESTSLYFNACRFHVHKSPLDILLASNSLYLNANRLHVHKSPLDISWQVVHYTSMPVGSMFTSLVWRTFGRCSGFIWPYANQNAKLPISCCIDQKLKK
jgi:hypothetical protein